MKTADPEQKMTDIRNSEFARRLIKPDNDQLKKMWKRNDKESTSDIVATLGQADVATISDFGGVGGKWGLQKYNINR